MPETTETTVPIRRVTVTTTRPFDEVVTAVYAGLGRVADFGGLVERWSTLSYDRVASAIAPYASAEASAVATSLDDAVLTLLRDAAG